MENSGYSSVKREKKKIKKLFTRTSTTLHGEKKETPPPTVCI